jgi:hypothetical protein
VAQLTDDAMITTVVVRDENFEQDEQMVGANPNTECSGKLFYVFARFCDPGGKIWGLIENTDDPKIRHLVIQEAMHCPSGRLTLLDKNTGKD